MSDPVTNVEIEDVLSSIRRLVSTEAQPSETAKSRADDSADTHATHADPARSEPKLVLTPAQRVTDADAADTASEPDPATPLHADDGPEVAQDDEPAPTEDNDEDDWVQDIEVASFEPADDDTDDTDAEDMAAHLSQDAPYDAHEREHPSDDTLQEDLQPDAQEGVTDTEGASHDDLIDMVADEITATIGADMAGDVQDQLSTSEEDDALSDVQELSFEDMSDPDVPEFLRRPITQMNPPEDAEIADAAPENASVDIPADTQADTQADASENTTITLTSKLETLEDAVADQAEDWEPDGGDPESLSADAIEPLPWTEIETETADMSHEGAEADPYSAAEAEANASANAATPPWLGEDALLDEDALRDMVGEIVRQELQGALGERITRNVRKLVRREIHRALMSQGLD